ncbi:hypothetical protein Tco_1191340 [Tanacetum coccineum]
MIFCTIESKPLALPWGRTPRLDSGVRNGESFCKSYSIPDEVHPTPGGTGLSPICPRRGSAPHLTDRQEQAVRSFLLIKLLSDGYPECFLALVGLSPYYPFGENTYPAFERPDRTDMGLLDYIRTADPRKVQAVEVQKGEEQVTLLESIKHCFVSLDAPAAVHQASGSGSGAGPAVSAPSAGENVVAEENVIPKQPEKAKRKKLSKQSDPLPAKRLRIDHPSLASGTGGKTLLDDGFSCRTPSRVADAPVYTAADTVTSSRGKTLVVPTSDVGGSSQPETSEESLLDSYL